MHTSRRGLLAAGAGLAACGTLEADKNDNGVETTAKSKAGAGRYADTVYELRPVGEVHNKKGAPVRLEIYRPYVPALHRLEHCSHVMVLWWFHKNDTPKKRTILKVHPRGNKNNPLTGVFATHSPVRPNLIAVTTCKVLSVEGNMVTIDRIDAFDGTPVLDLKSAGKRKTPLKK